MNPMLIMANEQDEWNLLETHIRKMGNKVSILEAGCGRYWPLDLKGMEVHLVGIDTDSEAIKTRTDLSVAIVGDICDSTLAEKGSFDVVFNSYVLEHVKGAEKALLNLVEWVRPGGLILLRIPDRDSAYGAATRLSPFWVHVLYKRLVQGFKEAGTPGFGPYPTYHERIVSTEGIEAFCEAHDCQILEFFGHGYYLKYEGGNIAKWLAIGVWLLSLGRFPWRHNDLTFVIQRRIHAD